ncbi:MAG: hypothetical protein RH948_12755 [Cyclobacteriaceae bacterium]
MKKLALSVITLMLAVALFGFVSYGSVSESESTIEKTTPITGVEKSGYSESNRASI